jgi:CBS domain-containing protein
MEAVRSFLAARKADSLPKLEDIVTFESDVDLPTAFRTLVEKRITSAPVYNRQTGEFVGFLDTRDLLAWCVFAADEKNVTPSLTDVLSMGAKASAVAITGITPSYLARRHPFCSVGPDDSLATLAALMARTDVHRVPVVRDTTLETIVSQSVLVKLLYDHRAELGAAMALTVESLGLLGSAPVLTVPATASARDAFDLMDKKSRSGLGVVDEEGHIIANTSASDIKLFLDAPQSLEFSITKFIGAIHAHEADLHAPAVSVHASSTLEQVLGKMAVAKVHRVFVTDAHRHPVAVISVTDIMRLISGGDPK